MCSKHVDACNKLIVKQKLCDRCDDTRVCVMQFWFPDDEHMCSKHVNACNKLIVKQKLCDRCDETRGCVMQFWSPDDEHMCSKHVDKLIVKQKFCASSWLITEVNILRCTFSKTSKK